MLQTARRKSIRPANTSRLDGAAWIEAALQVLAARGIDGVRIEVLSKKLGVTKGSFYWHFKDRGTLLDSMLQEWRRRATVAIIERLEATHEPPLKRLHRLLRLPFDAQRAEYGADIELSIRLWGRHDSRPAAVLGEIDELRLRYIGGLLAQLGTPPEESRARAVLIYSYMRVSRSLVDPVADNALIEWCEKVLINSTRRV
jgi:AcrR family transcriptional regulator